MTEVVLFHHAQGLTPGVVAFADELRHAGHTVHMPDLFKGRTFGTIAGGMAFAEEIGFPGEAIERGVRAVDGLPAGLMYAGFSLGVLPAQKLAQTRPGRPQLADPRLADRSILYQGGKYPRSHDREQKGPGLRFSTGDL